MNKTTIDALMKKTAEHLEKEADRRGIIHGYRPSKYELIQKILEHDAYYEGVNDARNNKVKNGRPGVVVETKVTITTEPHANSILYLITNSEDPSDYLTVEVTPEQAKMINWCEDKELFWDTISWHRISRNEVERP